MYISHLTIVSLCVCVCIYILYNMYVYRFFGTRGDVFVDVRAHPGNDPDGRSPFIFRPFDITIRRQRFPLDDSCPLSLFRILLPPKISVVKLRANVRRILYFTGRPTVLPLSSLPRDNRHSRGRTGLEALKGSGTSVKQTLSRRGRPRD